MELFVYGTLMVPRVMAAVCGYRRAGEPAILTGHRCRRVRGEVYPGIIAANGEQVKGLLYRDVSALEITRLDAFEGEIYERCAVQVRLGSAVVQSQTYRLAASYRDLLSTEQWTLEGFLTDGIERFVANYDGFVKTGAGPVRHG